ncbi:MAG: hypothetical protein DRR42_20210, partial [Gammaproteobacteria bacterium]
MELLVNDLSIRGQFADVGSFRAAIVRLMVMRNVCRKFRFELFCHQNMAHAQVTGSLIMPQVIRFFSQPERSALMQWLTKYGPYWEDYREHDSDDYLECNEEVVTDSAIGEAAFRCLNAGNCQLVSIIPSDWDVSPLMVWLRGSTRGDLEVAVVNHVDIEILEATLRAEQPPIESWKQLEERCCALFTNLKFIASAFDSLVGHPFVPGASQHIIERLGVLDRFRDSFDESGKRTAEGNKLYQDHFTGDKAWFSDSSDAEKQEFRKELTFKHPEKVGESLFCTMHGKVKTPQIRIHFSSPIVA